VYTFLVLTGENWPNLYYECMRVSAVAPIFFVTWIVLGQYILLNLVMVRGGG
jgi:hypothetical protein